MPIVPAEHESIDDRLARDDDSAHHERAGPLPRAAIALTRWHRQCPRRQRSGQFQQPFVAARGGHELEAHRQAVDRARRYRETRCA
jgi:hypothetical protein